MLHVHEKKVKTRTERLAHFALIALIVAVATNVAIGLTLKDRLDRLRPAPAVEPGSLLTEITGTDVAGKNRTVQLAGMRPTILYVSRRGCGWCERNHRNLKAIGLQASARFRILELSPAGIGPSGSPAFGVERLGVSEDLLQRIGARGTPYMVLLSPEGRVIDSWIGAFGPRTAPSVARTLQVELPGLIP
jgi:thioredoxin-related protein